MEVIRLEDIVINCDEAFALSAYKESPNVRTSIGDTIYQLKYNLKWTENNTYYMSLIRKLVVELVPYTDDISLILPIPSYIKTHYNEKIMYLVAKELSNYTNIPYKFDILHKLVDIESKSNNLTENVFSAEKLEEEFKFSKVLLIDDLFGEGTTANYVVNKLKTNNPEIKIKFISLTKNELGGIGKTYLCSLDMDAGLQLASNGQEYFILHFSKNGNKETLYLFEDNAFFEDVKKSFYENKQFELNLKLKKNSKKFWVIVE